MIHLFSEVPFEDSTQISVSNCERPTCELKQGTTATILIKLVPNRTIQSLINEVGAILFNIPLPFVGVDGTNACDNIYKPDGVTKVGCPLEKGQEYLYKNSFPILALYPRVSLQIFFYIVCNK